MTWATISTRQMVLKNRINSLESQLIKISQQLQSTYDDSSYDQQLLQMDNDEMLAAIQDQYYQASDKLYENARKGSSGNQAKFEHDNNVITKNYLYQKNVLSKAFTAKNNCIQDRTDAKTRALEAQQEQIETQLEAARAEYDQLDKACSQDIQKGAIKLTSQG